MIYLLNQLTDVISKSKCEMRKGKMFTKRKPLITDGIFGRIKRRNICI